MSVKSRRMKRRARSAQTGGSKRAKKRPKGSRGKKASGPGLTIHGKRFRSQKSKMAYLRSLRANGR